MINENAPRLAANSDTEPADPASIARWGHQLAKLAVTRFGALATAAETRKLTPQEIEHLRSLASQLRLMADACAGAHLAQNSRPGAQTRLF